MTRQAKQKGRLGQQEIRDKLLETFPDLEPDEVIQEDEEEVSETVVKSLDVVLDYKKASLIKLREIVQSKGLVTDASKMKKSDILKVLEGQ